MQDVLDQQAPSLAGLGHLLRTLELVQKRLNKDLELTGLLMTMFDPRTNLSTEVVDETRQFFGDKLCETIVRTNVRLAEAPSHGLSILEYDDGSRGAEDYRQLAEEILSEQTAVER